MKDDSPSGTGLDWRAWHQRYDADTLLRRRLDIVQRHISAILDDQPQSPLRIISMCAGEARDILGALDSHQRRDVSGGLVELDPVLAATARRHAEALGLSDLEVVAGNAGETAIYAPFVPADLVLACGVFGNISDADIENTLRTLPMLCAPGARVIWTRHRRPPDITPRIRDWLAESGFENTVFEPVPQSETIPEKDTLGSVGVAQFAGETAPFRSHHLFTFTRTHI